jgi:hypothetical protein
MLETELLTPIRSMQIRLCHLGYAFGSIGGADLIVCVTSEPISVAFHSRVPFAVARWLVGMRDSDIVTNPILSLRLVRDVASWLI